MRQPLVYCRVAVTTRFNPCSKPYRVTSQRRQQPLSCCRLLFLEVYGLVSDYQRLLDVQARVFDTSVLSRLGPGYVLLSPLAGKNSDLVSPDQAIKDLDGKTS